MLIIYSVTLIYRLVDYGSHHLNKHMEMWYMKEYVQHLRIHVFFEHEK